jgi:glycerophosphoryl diester phosphodiesterase
MRSLFILIITCLLTTSVFAQVKPLVNAHAHNDYEHEHPLKDALSFGFTSVEADVYLIDNVLYVSHDYPKELKGITLKALYLDPLQQIMKANGNKVYPDDNGVFYLMIDLKSDGETTYQKLHEEIAKYPEFINNPKFKIYLSGKDLLYTLKSPGRILAVDGRPKDIGHGYTQDEMPVVSESFVNITGWNTKDTITDAQWKKVADFIAAVHQDGKKCRIWGIPDQEPVWKKMLDYKMDFINTDRLKELAAFLNRTN